MNEQNYVSNLNAANQIDLITLGARCIAEISGRFFLLLEIEVGEIERVIVIRISAAQAAILLAAGVMRCRIQDTIPVATPGGEVNLICAFVEGNEVFVVFDVENTTDELVLVRVPLCMII